LQSLDSLYNDFVSAADLRYQTGETNLLEKTTAETKRGQLSLMLQQNLKLIIANAYASLKALLNINEDFTIGVDEIFQPIMLSNSFDTSLVANNPALKVMYQQAVIAEQNKKVETASTLPDLMLVISINR
jgi:cobalt-zinc-cadmium resistance protein CzcA